MTLPTLATERLTLRPPRMEDWPAFSGFFASARSRFMGGPLEDEGARWRIFAHIAGMWLLRGFGSFVFCRAGSDRPLGAAGPWFPVGWPEREIGWSIWDADAEGTGLAFEAARATRTHAYDTLGWDTAVSYVASGNARSIRLAERLGAVLDDTAARPDADDLVFRHPAPGAA